MAAILQPPRVAAQAPGSAIFTAFSQPLPRPPQRTPRLLRGEATRCAGELTLSPPGTTTTPAASSGYPEVDVEVAPPTSLASPCVRTCAPRLYEVVVRNLTSRSFKLQGPALLSLRRIAEGRMLYVQATLEAAANPVAALPRTVGPALAPDREPGAPSTAQASFSSSALRGDALEFALSYADGTGEGFTVRVHAHNKSPLRSDVVAAGQELDISSVVEEVPRLVVSPPLGYADTALGVYGAPARCETDRVGKLNVGDEVFAGSGPREGRWLRIVWPLQGWVQAETRDGRPLLLQLLPTMGGRPHLRQVVILRPRHGRLHTPAATRAASLGRPPSRPQEAEAEDAARAAERALSSAKAAEGARFERDSVSLERTAFVGRHRSTLRGVF